MSSAKRVLLLRVHRHRLRKEDLEDCYGQATLELLAHVRNGRSFADRDHLSHSLELRFLSRVRDRQRAVGGRSPMQAALESSASLGSSGEDELEIADRGAEVEALVMLRHELSRISVHAQGLTPDQRLVLAAQLSSIDTSDFCRRHGWSAEKYRKVAQRGRARLRRLMELDDASVPSDSRSSVG